LLFHLRRGDYSRWFSEIIKDQTLAEEARRAELSMSPEDSRRLILVCIHERYTAPASAE
jgi:hypothetical protein